MDPNIAAAINRILVVVRTIVVLIQDGEASAEFRAAQHSGEFDECTSCISVEAGHLTSMIKSALRRSTICIRLRARRSRPESGRATTCSSTTSSESTKDCLISRVESPMQVVPSTAL